MKKILYIVGYAHKTRAKTIEYNKKELSVLPDDPKCSRAISSQSHTKLSLTTK